MRNVIWYTRRGDFALLTHPPTEETVDRSSVGDTAHLRSVRNPTGKKFCAVVRRTDGRINHSELAARIIRLGAAPPVGCISASASSNGAECLPDPCANEYNFALPLLVATEKAERECRVIPDP